MRTWTPKVPEVSRIRVEELQRFCWQYREKKRESMRCAALLAAAKG